MVRPGEPGGQVRRRGAEPTEDVHKLEADVRGDR